MGKRNRKAYFCVVCSQITGLFRSTYICIILNLLYKFRIFIRSMLLHTQEIYEMHQMDIKFIFFLPIILMLMLAASLGCSGRRTNHSTTSYLNYNLCFPVNYLPEMLQCESYKRRMMAVMSLEVICLANDRYWRCILDAGDNYVFLCRIILHSDQSLYWEGSFLVDF